MYQRAGNGGHGGQSLGRVAAADDGVRFSPYFEQRWIMHLTPPPARKMIEKGVPVAVASDFNPNAYCMSMPFVMNVRLREGCER